MQLLGFKIFEQSSKFSIQPFYKPPIHSYSFNQYTHSIWLYYNGASEHYLILQNFYYSSHIHFLPDNSWICLHESSVSNSSHYKGIILHPPNYLGTQTILF